MCAQILLYDPQDLEQIAIQRCRYFQGLAHGQQGPGEHFHFLLLPGQCGLAHGSFAFRVQSIHVLKSGLNDLNAQFNALGPGYTDYLMHGILHQLADRWTPKISKKCQKITKERLSSYETRFTLKMPALRRRAAYQATRPVVFCKGGPALTGRIGFCTLQ